MAVLSKVHLIKSTLCDVRALKILPLEISAISALRRPFRKFSTSTVNCNGKSASVQTANQISVLTKKWLGIFKENDISEGKESIELIISHVFNTPTLWHLDEALKSEEIKQDHVERIEKLCEKRLKKLPIQYVLGEWDFRSLKLKMRPPVFIPRPETEGLVDLVIGRIDQTGGGGSVLELCCGSGAISLSILKETPHPVTVVAVDQSVHACSLTMENAQSHQLDGIRVVHSAVANLPAFGHQFTTIVSNPPYIFTRDMDKLQPEIMLYEDLSALDGGGDGLDVIKMILRVAIEALANEGRIFLEVEPRHPQLLDAFLKKNWSLFRMELAETVKDCYGKERFVVIVKKTI